MHRIPNATGVDKTHAIKKIVPEKRRTGRYKTMQISSLAFINFSSSPSSLLNNSHGVQMTNRRLKGA
jgi:hypothetical protein